MIVIEFVQWYLYAFAMSAIATSSGSALLLTLAFGAFLFVLSATIVYADIVACLAPVSSTLTLVPSSFYQSTTLAWHNFSRALALLFVQVAVGTLLQLGALGLHALHVRGADLWINDVAATLIAVPITAFATLVYLDVISQRPSEDGRRRV